MKRIKVTRVVVTEGEEWWVRSVLEKSLLGGVNEALTYRTPSGEVREESRIEEVVSE